MDYKLILLDLDGTLLDTSPGIYEGLDYLAPQIGRELLDESVKSNFIGPALSVSYPKYFGVTGEALQEAIDIYRDYYRREGYKKYKHYPGLENVLKTLKDKGYLLAVVTMKEHSTTEQVLEHAGLDKYLDSILGNQDMNSFTKSQLIEKTLEKFDLSPDQAVLIGDSETDGKGALEAHVDYIPALYGFGYSHNDSPEAYPNVYQLEEPSDLLNFLKKEEQYETC